jgi:hypothetical protein
MNLRAWRLVQRIFDADVRGHEKVPTEPTTGIAVTGQNFRLTDLQRREHRRADLVVIHCGVPLGGGDRRVPEQYLDGA